MGKKQIGMKTRIVVVDACNISQCRITQFTMQVKQLYNGGKGS